MSAKCYYKYYYVSTMKWRIQQEKLAYPCPQGVHNLVGTH